MSLSNIKRDILFQLIKDNRIYDFKEEYDKIFDAVCNGESLIKLADFVASIIPVEGIKDVYEGLKGLASTIRKKYKEQDVLHVVDDYLNGFYGKMGSISGNVVPENMANIIKVLYTVENM